MNKILIVIPYYFPGYRSGGPQQTIKNVVDEFGKQSEIFIYTQNHDFGVDTPYEEIRCNEWIKSESCRIMYANKYDFCGEQLKKLYEEFNHIYSCGLFEVNSIALLRIHKLLKKNEKKIYIAPMGVFSEGAINNKKIKKKAFLAIFKSLGFFKNIIWSFTSELEKIDAQKQLGKKLVSNYIIAEDLPRKIDFDYQINKVKSQNLDDTLRVIFLSRICAKKNLEYAIDILNSNYNRKIIFDIYGTIENIEYWAICKQKIDKLPSNVCVKYCGEVSPNDVIEVFSKYSVFLFPTKGENFGHVIYEALSGGCIPIISDTTPWNEIVSAVGYVNPLSEIERFKECINKITELKKNELTDRRTRAVELARDKFTQSVKYSGYKKII